MNLETIQCARERIAPHILTTPLLRMPALDPWLGCRVWVKLECMQGTGAFKLRGAMNRALSLTPEQLAAGIVAASSGNHGKAIAYTAKKLGAKATIVMPRTAPRVKIDAVRALGAEVILCDASERFDVAAQVCRERGATMVPPFNDETVMAGQGTLGLEILEQCPQLDTLVLPLSGGGLLGGVSTAVKAAAPHVKVCGAEPAALPRYTESLKAGHPVTVPQTRPAADALVAQTPGSLCYPYVAANTDAVAAVSDEYTLKAMKLLLMEGKLLAEPSACIGIGAVLEGYLDVRADENVCFVISGGSVGFEQLDQLKEVTYEACR